MKFTLDPNGPLGRSLKDAVSRLEAPGAAMQVTGSAVTLSFQTGIADLATGQPVDAGSLFKTGSLTKMLTGTTVLQLAEEGRIDLTAPAARYLPAETVAGLANGQTATVTHLLQHTSGIPSYHDPNRNGDSEELVALLESRGGQPVGREEMLSLARGVPADFQPGDAYLYNNTGYVLLGEMIEGVTGKSLAQNFQERIFDRAGMSNSSMMTDTPPAGQVHGYLQQDGVWIDMTGIPLVASSEGGLISTPADITAFMTAFEAGKLLQPETLELMTTPGTLNDGTRLHYGMGIMTGTSPEFGRLHNHDGEALGFLSFAGHMPDADTTVVFMTNGVPPNGGDRLAAVFAGTSDSLFSTHAKAWTDWNQPLF